MVNSIIKLINEFFINAKNFNYEVATTKLIYGLPANSEKQSLKRYGKYSYSVIKYLDSQYGNYIESYHIREYDKKYDKNTIWVFWAQGTEKMPELVKICLNSIIGKNKDCNVIVLTNKNFQQYIEIPHEILKKYKNGNIKTAHFSDILRYTILGKYGGIWLDATIYCETHIDREFVENDFFSLKCIDLFPFFPSNGEFSTYAISGKPNLFLFQCLSDLLINYFQNYEKEIDYLLPDYFIKLIMMKNKETAKLIQSVKTNNVNHYCLLNNISNKFDEEQYNNWITNDTNLFKLSYKYELKEFDNNNNPTYYHYIKQRYLEAKSNG